GATVSLQELAELVYGEFTAQSAWAAYALLKEGRYFTGDAAALTGRDAAAVEADEGRRKLKQQDRAGRDAFLDRLRSGALDLPGDSRFLQDVEALACGRTDRSRTMRDLGRQETPVEAHRLLLSAGVWTPWVNPHPPRFGLSLAPPRFPLEPPPADESRLDLTRLAAYAIDSPWSHDPDDAVSLEGNTLYVHVADPAAVLFPDSPADLEARGRGTTLYIPEGSYRMIAEGALPLYALGLSPVSPALTFKMTLNEDCSIADTDIFPSLVKVTRLSYGEADALAREAGQENGAASLLARLCALADRNRKRRLDGGGVLIDFPEVHITVTDEAVEVEALEAYRSGDMVRECMLLAGEGAARWALQRRLPFPYVSQEPGDFPNSPLPGMAGAYQLRRCMRPRTLSVKPGPHAGLGLEVYTQVTSPLRRYTDLLAHQQIRAFLGRGQPAPPLGEDDLFLRLSAAEAAAQANTHAERASRAFWTTVYLSDKKGAVWEGITLEKRGSRALFLIPALGMETQAPVKEEVELNGPALLTLKSVRIPEGEANFTLSSIKSEERT
ncbi:MAG: RNB domain-containing ribonuclease, partial [Spirochaetaceae bacterium]|nr:RNB domain-containing ribonuclease [Spirochaetaceae bacterium]